MLAAMIDFETLGTSADCAILEVAAVLFNDTSIIDTKFWSIRDSNGVIDYDTVIWWLKHGTGAEELHYRREDAVPERTAMLELFEFLLARRPEELWSRSPTFDEAILRHQFNKHGRTSPLSFRASRDCRTLEALVAGLGYQQPERDLELLPLHSALADARWQAECVIKARRWLKQRTVV